MEKLTFSGHETFSCKALWLKKGFDFISKGKNFNEDTAIGDLGVGKNMVASIRFWMRAFGVTDQKDEINHDGPAKYFFNEGWDPFLEDRASLWLLHYYLVKIGYASIYNLIFNDFRTERVEFTRDNLRGYLKRKCDDTNNIFTPKTIENDINVFLKNYLTPDKATKNIEEDFSSLLIDLNLVRHMRLSDERYTLQSEDRSDIPWQLILFAILDFTEASVVSFSDLLTKPNSPGLVFALTADALYIKIQNIVEVYPTIHFRDQYGIRDLSFDKRPDKWSVLGGYYGQN